LSRSGFHDAVLVLDPFPGLSYGHFLLGFFVDQLDETTCELSGGIFIRNFFFFSFFSISFRFNFDLILISF